MIGGGIAGTSPDAPPGRRAASAAVLVERDTSPRARAGATRDSCSRESPRATPRRCAHTGATKAREVWALTDENHDRQIEAAAGQEVGHRRLGTRDPRLRADGGARAGRVGAAAERGRVRGAMGRDARCSTRETARSTRRSLVAALARRAPAGAIREGVEVTAVEPRGNGVTVQAGDDDVQRGRRRPRHQRVHVAACCRRSRSSRRARRCWRPPR